MRALPGLPHLRHWLAQGEEGCRGGGNRVSVHVWFGPSRAPTDSSVTPEGTSP